MRITITCQTCTKSYDVERDNNAPTHAVSMWCNWCPSCEDRAEDYYDEGYNESDSKDPEPDPVPDNQLCFPFMLEEMGCLTKIRELND